MGLVLGLALRNVLNILAWRNVARDTMGLWTWLWLFFQAVTCGGALAVFGERLIPFVITDMLVSVVTFFLALPRSEHEPE